MPREDRQGRRRQDGDAERICGDAAQGLGRDAGAERDAGDDEDEAGERQRHDHRPAGQRRTGHGKHRARDQSRRQAGELERAAAGERDGEGLGNLGKRPPVGEVLQQTGWSQVSLCALPIDRPAAPVQAFGLPLNLGLDAPMIHASPPRTPDQPIEVAPGDWAEREFYLMMTALVIPRPIGWISTVSASGVRNLAPYSYFNLMGSDPFYVAFGSTGVKDTLTNLREVPEFVANIVDHAPAGEDELHLGRFSARRGRVRLGGTDAGAVGQGAAAAGGRGEGAPRMRAGAGRDDRNTHIVLGRIVHAHVDPSVWKDGRVDPTLLDPVCRLSGSGYARLGELVNVQRPVWSSVKGSAGQDAMPRAVKR